MYSEAQKKATMKYMKANYDEIKIHVPEGKKNEYRQFAEDAGSMLTPFIIQAIEEKIARDSQK